MIAFRLRATAAAAGLLLLVPAALLRLMPRPQAQGLERLLPKMALLQSLPAAPTRPVPQLWRERLGSSLASSLWRQQRTLWWQGWGGHGDGGAYLVVQLARPALLPASQRPPHSLQLNDLLVVASDPLALRALEDQLGGVQRPLHGLDRRCLALLQEQQAVFWKPVGLGGLSGVLAPLLLGVQEGCLALELDGPQLAFRGEASATPDPAGGPVQAAALVPPPPLAPSLLLELQGPSLWPLLQGLLSRQLVRDALASGYGIGPAQLDLLRQLPFRLQLRPLASGPFRAGLQLDLASGPHRQFLARLLNALHPRLVQQGLEDAPPQWRAGGPTTGAPTAGGPTSGAPTSTVLPTATWRRADGTVVGGWRWQSPAGQPPTLQLFLGPEPLRSAQPQPIPAGALQLRLRPAAMASSGLLPAELPAVIRQASQLQVAVQASRAPLSQLQGRLQLAPR